MAQAGNTVVVHFKNLASQPYSISPVGISYWKHSEGDGLNQTSSVLSDSLIHSYTPSNMSHSQMLLLKSLRSFSLTDTTAKYITNPYIVLNIHNILE